LAKSKVNRLILSHSVEVTELPSPDTNGSFVITAPEGYRVVSAFLTGGLDSSSSYAMPTRKLDSVSGEPVHPYLDQVVFQYAMEFPTTVTGTVIAERSDEPDVFVTV
jgi:hypothetical protein